MRITRDQYEAACRIGLEFHDRMGELGIVEAKRRLKSTGLNPDSATDLIYDVGHMLRGECYKRKLSEETTDDYLTWIRRDRGDAKLAMALQLHIDYRIKEIPPTIAEGYNASSPNTKSDRRL